MKDQGHPFKNSSFTMAPAQRKSVCVYAVHAQIHAQPTLKQGTYF